MKNLRIAVYGLCVVQWALSAFGAVGLRASIDSVPVVDGGRTIYVVYRPATPHLQMVLTEFEYPGEDAQKQKTTKNGVKEGWWKEALVSVAPMDEKGVGRNLDVANGDTTSIVVKSRKDDRMIRTLGDSESQ